MCFSVVFTSYSIEDYITMEVLLLKLFKWDANLPTAASFCSYFIEFIVNENDYNENLCNYSSLDDMRKTIKPFVWDLLQQSLYGRYR